LKIGIWIVFFGIIFFLIISSGNIFAQEQNMNEFLQWKLDPYYNLILVSIIIIIALSVVANYFWSKRKGRNYSAE